jgi:hypothetical protein
MLDYPRKLFTALRRPTAVVRRRKPVLRCEPLEERWVPSPLSVTAFTPTPTGFTASFNQPIDPGVLNLYSGASAPAPADVTVVGSASGRVAGSLVVDVTGTTITFVKTGGYSAGTPTFGLLPADTYTVTLRSAADGFRDSTPTHGLLDGTGAGNPGTNYVTAFTVAPVTAPVVSVPDFTRGHDQAVDVATPTTSAGLPLTLSDGSGVTAIALDLVYDPTLLRIRGGAVAPDDAAAGFAGTFDTATPGVVHITLSGPNALGPGPHTFATLSGGVPDAAPYGKAEVLDLRNVLLNAGAAAAVADDGVHVAAFLGDTDGSQDYSSQDNADIAQVTSGQADGFAAYPLTDPVVVADIDGNGFVNGQDSSLLGQALVGLPVPQVPPLPAAGDPDLRLSFAAAQAAAGQTVTVALHLTVTEPAGIDVASLIEAIRFDPAVLSVANVRTGSLLAGFVTAATVDNVGGTVQVSQSAPGTPLSLADGSDGAVLLLDVTVRPGAAPGTTALNLAQDVPGDAGPVRTAASDGHGPLNLNPAPTDLTDDAGVDATLTITAPVTPPGPGSGNGSPVPVSPAPTSPGVPQKPHRVNQKKGKKGGKHPGKPAPHHPAPHRPARHHGR